MQVHDIHDTDLVVKLVMVGDSGVGKSNLVLRWTENVFYEQTMPTVGVEYALKMINLNGKRIKVQIWDTAGHERFRAITSAYYRATQGCVLVYDVTSTAAFVSLNHWLAEVSEHAPRDVCAVIVGNKSDLVALRAVTPDEGSEYAAQHNVAFLETSAKDSTNIDKAFTQLVAAIANRMSKVEMRTSNEEAPAGVRVEIPIFTK
jgi:Ras-related protein Rab-11B